MLLNTSDGKVVDVAVDQGLCASSGACVFSLPAVFEFDEKDEAVVRDAQELVAADALHEAAYNCPAGAITVRTD